MISAAQGGVHEDGRETFGHSLDRRSLGTRAGGGRRRAGRRAGAHRSGRGGTRARPHPLAAAQAVLRDLEPMVEPAHLRAVAGARMIRYALMRRRPRLRNMVSGEREPMTGRSNAGLVSLSGCAAPRQSREGDHGAAPRRQRQARGSAAPIRARGGRRRKPTRAPRSPCCRRSSRSSAPSWRTARPSRRQRRLCGSEISRPGSPHALRRRQHRSIYGEASPDDATAFVDEGIEVHPLPLLPDERN